MKLSKPIFRLKSEAKKIKKEQGILLSEALNIVAQGEGYSSWGLLIAKLKQTEPKVKSEILQYLQKGDLAIVAAKPGLGKTTLTLELLVQVAEQKIKSFFYTLEGNHKNVASKLASINESFGQSNTFLKINFSEEISASFIIKDLNEKVCEDSIIAVDYLQLLDQKRSNPELQKQIEDLKTFAKAKGCVIIFISQVDRFSEQNEDNYYSLQDLRLPNPIDLNLFNKVLFLQNEKKYFVKPKFIELT